MKRFATLVLMVLALCVTASAAVWHVDKDNTSGVEDGTSWDTAFTTMQPAIDAAFEDGGGEVWVATGTYKGMEPIELSEDLWGPYGDHTIFTMREGVNLYGGFVGTESSRGERDCENNPSVLDAVPDTIPLPTAPPGEWDERMERYAHVFAWYVLVGADDTVLDGFTLTVNWPNDEQWYQEMFEYRFWVSGLLVKSCSSVIRNCRFEKFFAQGHYADPLPAILVLDNSAVIIEDCIFQGPTIQTRNSEVYLARTRISRCDHPAIDIFASADWCGFANSSRVTAENCVIDKPVSVVQGSQLTLNECRLKDEMLVRHDSSFDAVNCVFLPDFYRGNVSVLSASPQWRARGLAMTNCTVVGQDNERQVLLHAYTTPMILRNCIIRGEEPGVRVYGENVTVLYSNVQGGYDGEENIDEGPMFVNPENGDFRLRPGSPCIGLGAGGLDMGAYQFGDVTGDRLINAVDVQLVINGALGLPAPSESDLEGDGYTNAIDIQLVINAALGMD